MACLPALPEPPVNTMRFPEDMIMVVDANLRETERRKRSRRRVNCRACYIIYLIYNSLNRQSLAGGTGRMQR